MICLLLLPAFLRTEDSFDPIPRSLSEKGTTYYEYGHRDSPGFVWPAAENFQS
eukprot:COSAG01_NODE_198_length_22280_cov_21.529775_24_plen_53_part_00